MQAAGTLELVAEIAVAFAGFSGIVGVYRARTETPHDPRADLRLLVEYSLFLLAVALLPLLLWHGGLAEEFAWRLASLGVALFNIAYYVYRQKQVLTSAADQGIGASMRLFVVLDWLLIALLIVNSTGVLPWAPVVVYLVNLTYQLCGTGLTFLRFIAPLWKPAA
jgi:hypothetical protein